MISIVILNWNGSTMIEKYLPHVIQNSEGAEIVVADNASTDDSIVMLKEKFPDIRTIVLEKNWGFADGYNKAFEALEQENKAYNIPLPDYYILLNSDVRTESGWLEPLERYMNEHQDVAACQPKLLSDIAPDYFEYAGACGGYIDRYGYPYCRGRIFETVEKDLGQYDDISEILWATGACMMIRREDYWKAGGLDGRFFAHNEEIDLCWRLNIMGRKVVCIPQSKVYHLGGGTLPKGNPRKTYLNFRNNLTMLYKNLPEEELKNVMRMRTLLDYVAALQMLLLGKNWGDFKAVLKGRRDFKSWKKDFTADRKHIQASYKNRNQVKGKTTLSILWNYYIKGRKTFNVM
ncbi:MAG: glycosyltransferase family 2 protein [Prevotella sp.]|nr:glycosyltransferase family 2 protein [Candidatus Prevotella equi]